MLAALKSAFGIKDWPEYTREEVAKHNTMQSLWLVADGKVFDATRFAGAHPGGVIAVLKRAGGCYDCQEDYKFHSKSARELWKDCQIGVLSSDALKSPIPANAAPDPALIQAMTPAIRIGGKVIPPDVYQQPGLAKPTVQPALESAEGGGDDGGEDVIATGCCRGAPGECCMACPNAPKSVRARSDSSSPDMVPLRR